MSPVVRRFLLPALFVSAAGLMAGAQQPAAPAPVPPPLQKIDVPSKVVLEAQLVKRDVAPGETTGPHTHPGVEIAYVMEGVEELRVAGQPTRIVHAGESAAIPRETPHEARNIGTGPLVLVITYIVDKGAPVRSPAAPLPK